MHNCLLQVRRVRPEPRRQVPQRRGPERLQEPGRPHLVAVRDHGVRHAAPGLRQHHHPPGQVL